MMFSLSDIKVECSNLEVDYASEEVAHMVYAALAVDKEVHCVIYVVSSLLIFFI